jgi:hypothetical protein
MPPNGKGKKNLQLYLKHTSQPPLERGRKRGKKSPQVHPTQETTLGKKGKKVSTPFFPHFFLNFHL